MTLMLKRCDSCLYSVFSPWVCYVSAAANSDHLAEANVSLVAVAPSDDSLHANYFRRT